MINLGYNIIRVLLLLLQSGVLFDNFRTVQVRSPDDAKGNEFFALDFATYYAYKLLLKECLHEKTIKDLLKQQQKQLPTSRKERSNKKRHWLIYNNSFGSVETRRKMIGTVEQNGRNAEWHNVTTDDGYILSIFRIPRNSSLSNKKNKNRVIFLQHGLLATADSFAILDTTRSPAYLLSDAGYDVWFGNLRGNTYSRRHKTLSNDDPKFWDFSMDEYAQLDLPAMIDYVIKTTKQSRITYMGHSLGTTIIMMLLAEQQEYNDKIDCTVLLAPIAFWNQNSSSASFGLSLVRIFQELSPTGAFEVLPQNNLAAFLWKYICSMNKFTMELCIFPLESFNGKDREQVSPEIISKMVTYSSGGTSAKVFYHYLQHFDYDKFSHYDYNDDKVNFQRYGQIIAPVYNLTNIKTPIIAAHSLNDPLSEEEEVEYLLAQFSNDTKVINYMVSYRKFNHLDFIIAKDVKELLYDDLIQTMSEFHDSD